MTKGEGMLEEKNESEVHGWLLSDWTLHVRGGDEIRQVWTWISWLTHTGWPGYITGGPSRSAVSAVTARPDWTAGSSAADCRPPPPSLPPSLSLLLLSPRRREHLSAATRVGSVWAGRHQLDKTRLDPESAERIVRLCWPVSDVRCSTEQHHQDGRR